MRPRYRCSCAGYEVVTARMAARVVAERAVARTVGKVGTVGKTGAEDSVVEEGMGLNVA